jgi:hypothetical protein
MFDSFAIKCITIVIMRQTRIPFMYYLYAIKCAIKVTQEPQSGSMCITAGGA